MLKYKRTDIVVYFMYNDIEYRRVGGKWEVNINGIWNETNVCEWIETQYKNRTKFRELIKRRDMLAGSSILSPSDKNKENELSEIVTNIIDIIGINKYIDNNSEQLLNMLDNGEIELK